MDRLWVRTCHGLSLTAPSASPLAVDCDFGVPVIMTALVSLGRHWDPEGWNGRRATARLEVEQDPDPWSEPHHIIEEEVVSTPDSYFTPKTR